MATGSLLALIVLCLAWELVLAPVRPVEPGWPSRPCRCASRWQASSKPHVHLPLGQPGDLAVFHRRRGARLERQAPSQWLAWAEVALCLVLFTACTLHVRLRQRNARAAADTAGASV